VHTDPEDIEEEEWSGEPPEVGEEAPCIMSEGSLQTKRSQPSDDDGGGDEQDESSRASGAARPNGPSPNLEHEVDADQQASSSKRQRRVGGSAR
jgi:hypothetical protein